MKDQKAFFNQYNVKAAEFKKTKLKWDELTKIHDDYVTYRDSLESSAIYFFNTLMKSPNVHSVRYRIKHPEHLVEKIIRKKITDPTSEININNYKDEVQDLIGLRALHLFKGDWSSVHDYITATWNLKNQPTLNFRKGDDEELITHFKDRGYQVKEHKFGYRSVHYIIETQPSKEKVYAEIQVRTIFEEAWAEIDHTIRYPYEMNNPIFLQFLLILNRLSGSADEMGTFIKFLKLELSLKEEIFSKQLSSKEAIISDLEDKLSKLDIPQTALLGVKNDLMRLKEPNTYIDFLQNGLPELNRYIKLDYTGYYDFKELFNNVDLANKIKNLTDTRKSINAGLKQVSDIVGTIRKSHNTKSDTEQILQSTRAATKGKKVAPKKSKIAAKNIVPPKGESKKG